MTTASDQNKDLNEPAAAEAAAPAAQVIKVKARAKKAAEDPRRAALGEEFAAEIAQYQRQFGETPAQALDRVVAEQDELDRMIGNILALAA